MSTKKAIDILIDKIKELKNPTVVGLDPRADYTPKFLLDESFAEFGQTSKAVAEAFYRTNVGLIDALFDIVPAVKPQVAMYEQYGAHGMDAYIKTIKYAKQKGLIVIGDIKRSDIASTAEAYSDGHIGKVSIGESSEEVFGSDFITVNPYLGYDSIEPYIGNCEKYGRGLFVLVKTSNPNSGEIQDVIIKDGETVYEKIGKLTAKWGENLIGEHGFSSIGAVVGATHPEQGISLRKMLPNTFFLVPGYGAQGATAADIAGCFNSDGIGAIVNSSRGIIAAFKNAKYKSDFSEDDYAQAARQAALDMREDLEQGIN